MILRCHASREVPYTREQVFDHVTTPEGLMEIFKGYPPLIPGIRSAHVEGLAQSGALRPTVLTDGTKIVERILILERPERHRYDMAQMNTLQKLLCTNMVADWTFIETSTGTRVVWDYELHARIPLLGLSLLVRAFFEKAMQRALDRISF